MRIKNRRRLMMFVLSLGSACTNPGAGESSTNGSTDGDASSETGETSGGSTTSSSQGATSAGQTTVDTDSATSTTGSDSRGSDDGTSNGSESGGPSPGTCKRGIAYGYHSPADLAALSPGVSWWYNWSPRPDKDVTDVYVDAGFEFTPMVWGGSFNANAITADIRPDATALLGFNEPNFYAQANLSAQQAANLWPQLEDIADAHGLTLVSPAVNFCGGGCWDENPFSYLEAFFAACQGCRVDAIAAHWYACDGPALEWYLGELEAFGKPIWLTEFACGDGADLSLAVQLDYMEDALMILEANPNVVRYAWFSGRTNAIPNVDLLGADGELTELGELYVSAPAADGCTR